SNICASTTPGLSRKSARSISPFSTRSTASRLQSGHSDWVLLGTPTAIGVRSRCFRRRPGAQLGLGKSPSGNKLLILRSTFQVIFAAPEAMSDVKASMAYLLYAGENRSSGSAEGVAGNRDPSSDYGYLRQIPTPGRDRKSTRLNSSHT